MMKRKAKLCWATLLAVAVMIVATSTSAMARNPDSAEFYLAYADKYLDQTIKLDVSHVEPVHFISPVQGVAFLRVATIDNVERRNGGMIMMVLPVEDKEKVIKKYGLNHERAQSKSMKVVLRQASGRIAREAHYLADYEGKAWELVKDSLAKVPFDWEGRDRLPGPR